MRVCAHKAGKNASIRDKKTHVYRVAGMIASIRGKKPHGYRVIILKQMADHNILTEKNPYFAKHLFAKQQLITRTRRRGQDFVTGKNFSFNQCHTKSSAFFSRESYFIKAIENFFPVFA